MGSRGPKPKSEQERQAQAEFLKVTAQSWATFFYTLRDGSPGVIQSVEWGPWEEWPGLVKIGPGEIVQSCPKEDGTSLFRKSKRIVGIKFLGLDTSVADEEKIFRELKTRDDLIVYMPVKPSPGLWQRLRDARTATEHESAVLTLEEWWKALRGTGEGSLLPAPSSSAATTSKDEFRLLASRVLFDARKLWLYPRTDRPKSDDKRIEFFAKAAAGLLLGIAPATALRKLTRVRFAKDLVGQQRREFVERIQSEIKNRRAEP